MKTYLFAGSALALLIMGGVAQAATQSSDYLPVSQYHNGTNELATATDSAGGDSGSADSSNVDGDSSAGIGDDDSGDEDVGAVAAVSGANLTQATNGPHAEASSRSSASNDSASTSSEAHPEGNEQDSASNDNDGTHSEARAEANTSDSSGSRAHAAARRVLAVHGDHVMLGSPGGARLPFRMLPASYPRETILLWQLMEL